MNAEMVTRLIQTILAPVVMVSACALMLNGLLSHYAAINDRLRLLARERLDLLRQPALDALLRERLDEIDTQLPELLHRHRLMRSAVLVIYSAIAIFIVDMLVIALATVTQALWLLTSIVVVFLLGTLGLLLGVILATWEIRASHRAIDFEVQRVLSLKS